MALKIEVTKPEMVFEVLGLEEFTIYKVLVKHVASNPTHIAFLFTGFKNGNHCVVYVNNYEVPVDMMRLYSLKVIKKLCSIKEPEVKKDGE